RGGGGAGGGGGVVGGVLQGDSEPGDGGGGAAREDRGVAGGELADHVRGHRVVPAPAALIALPVAAAQADPLGEGCLPAQFAGHFQRGGGGDAGQPHLDPAGVQDDLGAVLAPPGAQLRPAPPHRDELEALPAGVGQPGRQRDRASLDDLVQGHQQRRVQPSARHGLPGLGGDVVDLPGHGGEQRGDRAVVVLGLGDQVQRP